MSTLLNLSQNTALLLALTFIYDFIYLYLERVSRHVRNFLNGVLFGSFAVIVMAVLGGAIGFGLYSLPALPALLAATGVVQVHFLLDAKVWRLSDPRQRAIMNRRFDFLLAR